MDFIKTFNEKRRSIIWKQRGDKIKTIFRENLEILKFKDDKGHCDKSMQLFEQVGIGYDGLGTSFMSGIQSEASIGLSSKETVNDHLIGTKKIGEIVHDELKKSNYDIDSMVNKWLYNNLYLWATIKVTKKEHHKDNILRSSNHTPAQKLNMDHYINVSKRVFVSKKKNF